MLREIQILFLRRSLEAFLENEKKVKFSRFFPCILFRNRLVFAPVFKDGELKIFLLEREYLSQTMVNSDGNQ